MKADARGRESYHHGDLRAALLVAALHELEENGIEGFSLRGVAKRAGVSHAAPAHHFKDTRGLLTALAGEGYRQFLATQLSHQAKAKGSDPLSKLVASGLGYVAFATAHPALFRLIFSSDRPDRTDPELMQVAGAAYQKLVADVARLVGARPEADGRAFMVDVISAWAVAHGLADLMNSGRMAYPTRLKKAEQQDLLADVLRRTLARR
jgi:AcrR family transcriptional regulator